MLRRSIRGPLAAIFVTLLASSPVPTSAQVSSDPLTSSIASKSSEFGTSDPLTLRFVVSNNSDTTLSVLKWRTPLEGLYYDMFVVEKAGERIAYIGRVVKRGLPQPEDYITLKPGEVASAEVDLAQGYAIYEAGEYRVTLKTDLLGVHTKDPIGAAAQAKTQGLQPKGSIESNSITFELLGSRPKQTFDIRVAPDLVGLDVPAEKRTPVFRECSSSRRSALNQALTKAEQVAEVASFDLVNTPLNKRANAQRHKTWFGSYTSTRYNTVASNFGKIYDALDNKTMTFDCGCTHNWYAYVYSNRPYEIWLCNAFWSAPLTGTDSKAGTIVHEVSHFNVVAGTDDHTYGQSSCKQLAINDPAKAIANADSHEYFAENTPALSMPTAVSACSLCSTCGGHWPRYSGTIGKLTPASSYAPKERGSGCSGPLQYRNDTYPYLCCQ